MGKAMTPADNFPTSALSNSANGFHDLGAEAIRLLCGERRRVDVSEARRSLSEAMLAWPGVEGERWWKWLVETGRGLGYAARVIDASPREVYELLRHGVEAVTVGGRDGLDSSVFVLTEAKRKNLRLTELPGDLAGRWVSQRELSTLLGGTGETVRRWVVLDPMSDDVPLPSAESSTEQSHHNSEGHEAHSHRTPWSRLWDFLRPEASDLWIVFVFALLIGMLSLATPIAVEAVPEVAAPPPAPAKNDKRCARHPANVAQHICPKCRAYACDTCGSLSSAGGKPKVFCPVCGAKAQPLAEFERGQAERQARADLSFQQQVKGVFKYPFGKGGLALLIIGSLMFFGLDVLVTWGWKFRFIMLKAVSSVGILALFSAGYLCAWLQKILFATAEGEDDVPGWPDFMDWKDDIVMPFRLAIAAFVASFGPAFGYLIFHAVNDSEMRLPVLFPLFALGFIYFPMALLAVAMSNNWLAVNPLVVMPAIARLNLQYVVACVVFFGMVLVRFVSESLLHAVLPIPVLPGLISSFIALYFLCVEMRLLGLLYFTNKKRLGWFSA